MLLAATLVAGCGGPHIDYIDFIRFNGITYVHRPAYPLLAPQYVGRRYATVKAHLQDTQNDPNYQPRDGDSAFLTQGTLVYTVLGYRATFRLAAPTQTGSGYPPGYIYYEAESVPGARTVADWLDIRGKVVYIGINHDYAQDTEVGSIKAPEQVRQLVDMLLDTPFGPSQSTGNTSSVLLDFHLQDGTATFLPYYPDTHAITPTLRVPLVFAAAIDAAYPH